MKCEVVVIGAGLAGLVAAVALAQLRREVLVIEAMDAPGGLCRTINLDGQDFVIGCNDFGSGLARLLERLGASPGFEPTRSRFVIDGHPLRIPPDLRTTLALLARAPELIRVVRSLRRCDPDAWMLESLGPLSERVRGLLLLLPYALGLSDMRVDQLRSSFSRELDYGYDHSVVPIGGPGAITARLVERLDELGGRLELGARAELVEAGREEFVVERGGERVRARAVISSQPRRPLPGSDLREGLRCASFHLAVDSSYAWPKGIHALAKMPAPSAGWLEALERGESPAEFGFHCFNSRLPTRGGRHAVSGFFFLPRGREQPSETERRAHAEVIDRGLEQIAPGLLDAVRYRRVLYPSEYRDRVGCDPRPCALVHDSTHPKPPMLDEHTGVYHVGNSVQPPGEHAGAAALSGWNAAQAVHAELSARVAPS